MNFGSLGFSLMMFAAGVGIPIMAAMNAGLGQRIANPSAAGFVLFLVAVAVTGVALVYAGPPSRAALTATPPQYFLGGVLIAFYVLSIAWAAPVIGLGNAVFLVLLGQLCSTAIIDHFGLFGARITPLTWWRIAGLVVMAIGVWMARRP